MSNQQSATLSRRTFVAGAAVAAGAAAVGVVSRKANADEALAGYTPGTYTGTGNGVGTVTATVTFDETSMTEVLIDVSGETVTVGRLMAEPLQTAFMDAQSADIDAISGATVTTYGARQAVASCIAQAQGTEYSVPAFFAGSDEDWLGEEPEVDESQISETWDTDILIVGAGNAGMAAAAYAAQNGLNFRVIEVIGSVGRTRGWYGAVDSSAAQAAGCEPMNRGKLLSEISRYASGKCNQSVVKMWINESAAMHDFVASILEAEPYNYTCTFTSGEASHWPDECGEENTTYFFPEMEHTYNGAEKARNEVFEEYVLNQGYTIDYGMSLVKLEKDGERVCGAIAQRMPNGELVRINAASGVLLACGGYAGNPYMMQALDPLASRVTTCEAYNPMDRGQGIRAALWAGAAMDTEAAPMLFDRGLVAPGVDAGYEENAATFGGKEFPGTLAQYGPGTQPFLKVNRNGLRFMNESQPYNDAPYAAGNQPGGVYCQVFDANNQTDVQRFHTIGCSAGVQPDGAMESRMAPQIEAGLVMQADTLEELADKLGFEGESKENFLATVERYNELYDAQNDEDFGKPAIRLSEIRTAPFYGAWLGASLLTTMQGITINENAQAMNADRTAPIEGLYVAGDNAGGIFANNYPCLMPGLRCGSAMVQGIKAIKQMGGLE